MQRWLFLTLALISPAACGGSDRPPGSTLTYDSAGVTVVVNSTTRPSRSSVVSVDAVALTIIDTREGEGQIPFYRLGGATRLPDGRIVVGDAGEIALRQFSTLGEPIRSFGRFGRGPGEVSSIGGLTSWGDTTVVFDNASKTAVLYDTAGQPLGQLRLHTAARNIREIQRLSDGEWVGRGHRLPEDPLPPEQGYGRRSVRIVVLNRGGGERASIGTFPDAYTYSMITLRRGDVSYVEDRPVPFSPRFTFASDGELIFVGTGETYEILVTDRLGKPVRVIRREWNPQQVTRREREAAARRISLSVSASEGSATDVAVWVERHSRSQVPPYSRFLTDAAGFLWVAEYPVMMEEPTWWAVYDLQGHFIGDVEVPGQLAVIEIGIDYILGARQDDLGRESLYVYRLSRGSGSGGS